MSCFQSQPKASSLIQLFWINFCSVHKSFLTKWFSGFGDREDKLICPCPILPYSFPGCNNSFAKYSSWQFLTWFPVALLPFLWSGYYYPHFVVMFQGWLATKWLIWYLEWHSGITPHLWFLLPLDPAPNLPPHISATVISLQLQP